MSGWFITKTHFFLDWLWQIRNVQLNDRSLNHIMKKSNTVSWYIKMTDKILFSHGSYIEIELIVLPIGELTCTTIHHMLFIPRFPISLAVQLT